MTGALRHGLAANAGRLALDALLATVRFEIRGEEHYRATRRAARPVIFVLWHGRLLPLAYLHRRQGIAALISRSNDGEYIARIVEAWGYVAIRGSSSRGGSTALREIVRHARAGRSIAVTPDGPRGPRQQMKLGVLKAAQLTGLPLLPLVAGTDRAWWPEGWDRFLVPKPFARIRIAYGAPYEVPRDADQAELERRAAWLEAEMNRLLLTVDGAGDDR